MAIGTYLLTCLSVLSDGHTGINMKPYTKILFLAAIITFNLQLLPSIGTNCLAQYVTIPDTSLVKWLNKNGFTSCMKGNQLDTTCPAVLSKKTFDCSYSNINNLTGIQYFKSLDTLICLSNNLTSLPPLPASVTYIECSFNQLTSLPQLPASLNLLSCFKNKLTSIPPLPASFRWLSCGSNQLTSLPALPDSLQELDVHDNADLSCLPSIKKINTLNFEDTNIKCVPDLGHVTNSTPALESMPLCSKSNPNNCPVNK
jgi:hypothetical protein